MKKLHIILDGGHGFETPGKRSPDGSLRENEFNDAVVNKLAYQLWCADIPYFFVAPEWNDIPLRERTDRAIKYCHDQPEGTICLFLSIHADAFPEPEPHGSTVFYYSHPLAVEWAEKLGFVLENFYTLGCRNIMHGNFKVIRDTDPYMPSILLESGFMTNPDDLAFLKTDAGRNELTDMLFQWIQGIRAEVEEEIIV